MSSLRLPRGELFMVGFQPVSTSAVNGQEPRWKALLAKRPRGKAVCALSSSHIDWCDEDDTERLRRLVIQAVPKVSSAQDDESHGDAPEEPEEEARLLNRLGNRSSEGIQAHRPVAAQFPRR